MALCARPGASAAPVRGGLSLCYPCARIENRAADAGGGEPAARPEAERRRSADPACDPCRRARGSSGRADCRAPARALRRAARGRLTADGRDTTPAHAPYAARPVPQAVRARGPPDGPYLRLSAAHAGPRAAGGPRTWLTCAPAAAQPMVPTGPAAAWMHSQPSPTSPQGAPLTTELLIFSPTLYLHYHSVAFMD